MRWTGRWLRRSYGRGVEVLVEWDVDMEGGGVEWDGKGRELSNDLHPGPA